MDLRTLPRARLRAFVYQRASVDPLKKATSTDAQYSENVRVCEFNEWDIVGNFTDDGLSASRHAKKARKDWDAMAEAIRRGEADVIVAWADSRAYRDLEAYLKLRKLCEECGVLLCYNGTVYDLTNSTDRFVTGLNALIGERQADDIRDGVLRTTRANAVLGRPHGRIPYGYRRTYDPKTGDLIAQVVYEPEAAIVREMAKRISDGETGYKIAKDFNLRGFETPTGSGPWTAEMVKGILLKPTYVGKRQHQGRVIGKAEWDAILEEAVYSKCERILNAPARKTTRDNAIRWLLSGIVVCECGGVIRMRRNRHAPSYTCVTKFCTSIRIDKFDAIVQAELLGHVEKPEFVKALVPADTEDVAAAALAEAAEMERELVDARERAQKRLLSVASLSALEQTFQPLIDAARERARSADVPPILSRLAGAGAREVWAALDLPERRDAIRAVMTVQLNKAHAHGARYITEDRYTIEFLR